MHLGCRLLRLDHLVTFDRTHTTDSLGFGFTRLFDASSGWSSTSGSTDSASSPSDNGSAESSEASSGYLISDVRSLLGVLDSGAMHLRCRLLRLDHLVTFDRTHTTDGLGFGVLRLRRRFFGPVLGDLRLDRLRVLALRQRLR